MRANVGDRIRAFSQADTAATVQARRRAGVWIFMLAIPFPVSLPTGKSRIFRVP